MTATLLGTGTSQGVPVIGCDCPVCQSDDPRDQRLRCAVLIQHEGGNIAIDCGPDFRQQMLRARVTQLDAILITHEHNDHVVGMDDVRPFNFMQRIDMPVYARPSVQAELKTRFAYAFAEKKYPGAPGFELHTITKDEPLKINGLTIQPIEIWHGQLPIFGFRIGAFAYLTDVKTIDDDQLARLKGLDTLVLSALHHAPHHAHLNLEEAIELAQKINAKATYLTHCSHRMGRFMDINPQLPAGIQLAYDGLQCNI